MKIKHQVKLWYKTQIFNLSKHDNIAFIGFYKYLYKPKAGSLSAFLDQYSRQTANIKFIQVGANDGFNHDPIHKFVKRDNWKGVMLEPQPYVFDAYLQPLHQNNPDVITINAALNHTDGMANLYALSFSKARWATGLSSFDRTALSSKLERNELDENAAKEGVEIPREIDDCIDSYEIITISPASIQSNYVSSPDVLMVDTEGFDFEVLKMMHLPKLQPDVIIFEESHFDKQLKRECCTYLDDAGYVHKALDGNRLAILSTSENALAAFKQL